MNWPAPGFVDCEYAQPRGVLQSPITELKDFFANARAGENSIDSGRSGRIEENAMPTQELPRARRVIRANELRALTGLGPTQTAELVKRGEFPAPFRCGVRAKGWFEDEIRPYALF